MKIELPLDGRARRLVRGPSKALFQSGYGLEIMVAIAQRERFYQGELADLTGCRPSYVGNITQRLAAGGLIEALEAEPGQVRRYYRRLPSPVWDFCVSWAEDLLAAGEADADVTRLRSRTAERREP